MVETLYKHPILLTWLFFTQKVSGCLKVTPLYQDPITMQHSSQLSTGSSCVWRPTIPVVIHKPRPAGSSQFIPPRPDPLSNS